MRATNILEAIGNTPHLRLNRLFDPNYEVWIKLERQNPGASIKDRIAFAMIEDAERRGVLTKGSIIIEPTSGNTGIGLAMVAAVKGYELILVMPESMSIERRRVMAAYGAKLDLTPREKGMRGAISRAEELVAQTKNSWMPQQFNNQANVEIHKHTTAQEVLADFPEGLDAIVTGVGTGGHITAFGEVLKPKWPKLKIWAVEPAGSPVLSGGAPGLHPLQGLGAGFVPAIFKREAIDDVLTVEAPDAFNFARRAAKEEGLFVGPSTGAALSAITQVLPKLPPKSRILTVAYDTGERYLSVDALFA